MTKQDVLIPDTQAAAINMAITVAVTTGSLFAATTQKPPSAAPKGGYITISRKKLLKDLEINGGAKINAWVDSMRASSPTHIKSASPSLRDDLSAWLTHHPSMLDMFHEIAVASKGKQINREANEAAHHLAKWALNRNYSGIIEQHFPQQVIKVAYSENEM